MEMDEMEEAFRVYEEIADRQGKLAVVGLGYVGLPIAVAFSKRADVIGFDVNTQKLKAIAGALM